jgi:hypothetical protein
MSNSNNDLINTYPIFNENPCWENPIPSEFIDYDFVESNKCTRLFDQNGYDLSPIEIEYAKYNQTPLTIHRNVKHYSIQNSWFTQPPKLEGYVLNHSMILERKGYTGKALVQLQTLAKRNPLLYKVINNTPKWGSDISIDYVDRNGECFEILHHEYDSFDCMQAQKIKYQVEKVIESLNFNVVAKDLIVRKDEWMNLEFFPQSDWKCEYFGIPNERFKVTTWQK